MSNGRIYPDQDSSPDPMIPEPKQVELDAARRRAEMTLKPWQIRLIEKRPPLPGLEDMPPLPTSKQPSPQSMPPQMQQQPPSGQAPPQYVSADETIKNLSAVQGAPVPELPAHLKMPKPPFDPKTLDWNSLPLMEQAAHTGAWRRYEKKVQWVLEHRHKIRKQNFEMEKARTGKFGGQWVPTGKGGTGKPAFMHEGERTIRAPRTEEERMRMLIDPSFLVSEQKYKGGKLDVPRPRRPGSDLGGGDKSRLKPNAHAKLYLSYPQAAAGATTVKAPMQQAMMWSFATPSEKGVLSRPLGQFEGKSKEEAHEIKDSIRSTIFTRIQGRTRLKDDSRTLLDDVNVSRDAARGSKDHLDSKERNLKSVRDRIHKLRKEWRTKGYDGSNPYTGDTPEAHQDFGGQKASAWEKGKAGLASRIEEMNTEFERAEEQLETAKKRYNADVKTHQTAVDNRKIGNKYSARWLTSFLSRSRVQVFDRRKKSRLLEKARKMARENKTQKEIEAAVLEELNAKRDN